jgi:uncharacterized membrane protein YeaQ/YmgE (transglycosylase-associated protein family)
MDQPVTLLGTPNTHFVSLIIIGGLAGWIGGMIVGWRHGLFTNIVVGIAGSWIGSGAGLDRELRRLWLVQAVPGRARRLDHPAHRLAGAVEARRRVVISRV